MSHGASRRVVGAAAEHSSPAQETSSLRKGNMILVDTLATKRSIRHVASTLLECGHQRMLASRQECRGECLAVV